METPIERSERILLKLMSLYPGKKVYDLSGKGTHFVCEIEPVEDHPEYDKAVEVIISSEPHKHLKMTQVYKILEGSLTLYVDDKTILLNKDEQYTVEPGKVHSAEGDDQTLVEIYSTPGWTKEDHIKI
jgi:mannose-6-phosphate isomerase-like protein (cupin superfamily)